MKNSIRLDLNLKSVLMYETLSGKPFMSGGMPDMDILGYSVYMSNEFNTPMKIEDFRGLVEHNEKFRNRLGKMLAEGMDIITSIFGIIPKKEAKDETEDGKEELGMKNVISYLIMTEKLDPHFVLYEMDIWMMAPLMEAVESRKRNEMTEKRFWTYLSMLPHIDGKKLKSPEDLLPFEWEKQEKKEKAEKSLDDIGAGFAAFMKKQKKE